MWPGLDTGAMEGREAKSQLPALPQSWGSCPQTLSGFSPEGWGRGWPTQQDFQNPLGRFGWTSHSSRPSQCPVEPLNVSVGFTDTLNGRYKTLGKREMGTNAGFGRFVTSWTLKQSKLSPALDGSSTCLERTAPGGPRRQRAFLSLGLPHTWGVMGKC